jgi:hypothetical protein
VNNIGCTIVLLGGPYDGSLRVPWGMSHVPNTLRLPLDAVGRVYVYRANLRRLDGVFRWRWIHCGTEG